MEDVSRGKFFMLGVGLQYSLTFSPGPLSIIIMLRPLNYSTKQRDL
jgi:hypothetical protein